jgi:hypothetical protein
MGPVNIILRILCLVTIQFTFTVSHMLEENRSIVGQADCGVRKADVCARRSPTGWFWRLKRPTLSEIPHVISGMCYTGIQMYEISQLSRLGLRLEAACSVHVP